MDPEVAQGLGWAEGDLVRFYFVAEQGDLLMGDRSRSGYSRMRARRGVSV